VKKPAGPAMKTRTVFACLRAEPPPLRLCISKKLSARRAADAINISHDIGLPAQRSASISARFNFGREDAPHFTHHITVHKNHHVTHHHHRNRRPPNR